MDGLKGKLTHSLQFKLSAWLSLVIIVVAVIGGAYSYHTAFIEANEMQDDQLRQVAGLFKSKIAHIAPPVKDQRLADFKLEFLILVQVLTPSGVEVLSVNQKPLVLPKNINDGLQTISLQQEPWRIYITTLNASQRLVVAQKIAIRNEVADESATATLIPYAILIPLLLLVIAYFVRQMFRPIAQLARDIDLRSEQDLQAIKHQDIPIEIVPFVAAINRMLLRIEHSVELQRRFVADAAHEMRTPLTALSLQVERLEATQLPDQARQRLLTLKNGLERTRLLLNQLLAFARAQQVISPEKNKVSVQRVFRSVLEDLLPLADVKHIDVGVVSESDIMLFAHEFDLIVMIKNLVDNAIRYTPEGGKIDLSVEASVNSMIIKIADTGTGIPKSEQERVFDPFYRVMGHEQNGSGLGLSIVKAIAIKMQAQIQMGNSVATDGTKWFFIAVEIPNQERKLIKYGFPR